MNKNEIKRNIKSGVFYATGIGATILLGAVGGMLLDKLKLNCILKGLAYFGWIGISSKASYDAAHYMEEGIDECFEAIEEITEERKNNKGISA